MLGELGLEIFGKGKPFHLHEVLEIMAGTGHSKTVEWRRELLHIDPLRELLWRVSLGENIADADGGAAGQAEREAERRSGERKTGETQAS